MNKFFRKGLRVFVLLLLIGSIAFNGCSTDNPTTPGATFKGYIYFSNGSSISRIQPGTEEVQKLFSDAVTPDFSADGKLLAVETSPRARIFFSDITGATRTSIIEGVDHNGPKYRHAFTRPRISYNGKYIAYDGVNAHNQVTYVIDVTTASLVAEIGDYSAREPLTTPSWAPDGSLLVEGLPSMNNGIYKVASDFTTYQRIDQNLTNVAAPSVSPDGKSIAFLKDGEPWIMDIDGANPRQLYTGLGNVTIQPAWSPDSKFIALVSSGGIQILDLANKTITKINGKGYYIESTHQLRWQY
jgi:Tol biopolymer transport system component